MNCLYLDLMRSLNLDFLSLASGMLYDEDSQRKYDS